MLELLIVRAYRYQGERQHIVNKISVIWEHVARPPQVRVATRSFPPKVIPYASTTRFFPFIWRSWVSLQEWLRTPARWIGVFDADVTPTRQDAIHLLLDEIHNSHNNTSIITSAYSTWLRNALAVTDTGTSRAGLPIGFSDGIIIVRGDMLGLFTLLLHTYASQTHYRYECEAVYPTMFPPCVYISELPPTLWGGVYDYALPKWRENQPLPAFIQFVGDLRAAREHIHMLYNRVVKPPRGDENER